MTEARRSTMSLVGRLEDIELPELIQFLANNRKTGRLTLSRRDGHGVVLMRLGRILYAASNSIRETLGHLLVGRGLISETTLMEALEHQHWGQEGKRLGEILLEMGKLEEGALEDVMKDQTRAVIQELFEWTAGFFKFETLDIPDRGDVEVDARDFLLMKGVNTDEVLLEAARRLDESRDVLPGGAPSSLPSGAVEEPHPALAAARGLADLRAPALRGETTLNLMRQAAQVVSRGLLLAVRGDEAQGVGQFAIPAEGAGEGSAKRLRLPLDVPSVLADAVLSKEPYLGPLDAAVGNETLVERLGGARPTAVLVVPMIVAGSVAMLFYGDNATDGRPIGPTEGLTRLILEASLAMEKTALEERMRDFDLRYPRP
jgi:Domain of unknown function (DUF4388)